MKRPLPKPRLADGQKDRDFFWWDVGILLFYISEFTARLLLHRQDLLCGPLEQVWTYWFDLFIVIVGSSELTLGLLQLKSHIGVWATILQCLRIVRVPWTLCSRCQIRLD